MEDNVTIEPAGETESSGGSAAKTRKRMTVFRAEDGIMLGPDHMPFVGMDESVMAGFGKLQATGSDPNDIPVTKILFKTPGDDGLSLSYAWFRSGYILPRHSHSADCVYYVLAGELKAGTVVLKKGDGIFVPAEHGYSFEAGAQGAEILEFRNATHFNIHFKGNDDAHWDRMAKSQIENRPNWKTERPPSEVH